MDLERSFFLCPTCFHVELDGPQQHAHPMLRIDAAVLDDERRKPLTDAAGQIRTHAPRWFIEAMTPHSFESHEA